MRKIILYTAVSIDGFIAKDDGTIDWLSSFNNGCNDDHGYKSFYESIDTTLMGNKTYQQILTFPVPFPYPEKTNYVFSHGQHSKTEFVEYVNGKDIWLVGGAELNQTLLKFGLIDEIILTIIPIVLGKGIHLFAQQSCEQQFKYSDSKVFPTGCVQIKYII